MSCDCDCDFRHYGVRVCAGSTAADDSILLKELALRESPAATLNRLQRASPAKFLLHRAVRGHILLLLVTDLAIPEVKCEV